MNGLVAEGFVLLGGLLEGTHDVLLSVRGESVDDVERHLAADVWVQKGLLRQRQISPRWVRLRAFDAT